MARFLRHPVFIIPHVPTKWVLLSEVVFHPAVCWAGYSIP